MTLQRGDEDVEAQPLALTRISPAAETDPLSGWVELDSSGYTRLMCAVSRKKSQKMEGPASFSSS